MKSESKDLRELVRLIEEVCRAHRAYSMAWPAVSVLSDYLCLRAHIMDLGDPPAPKMKRDGKTQGLGGIARAAALSNR